MADYRTPLFKAAENARIHLQAEEADLLVGEIEEILRIFDKIDAFREPVKSVPPRSGWILRSDKVYPSPIDPFGNSRFILNRKFIGPRLVD